MARAVEKIISDFGGENLSLGRYRHSCGDNIKIHLAEVLWEGMDWIYLG
jgi:hypothetical protein